MTPVSEPVPGYDDLKTRDVIKSLKTHSQADLTKIDAYERANQAREHVFHKLRWLRQDEPVPGYDEMTPDELTVALKKADAPALKRIRGYERTFAARREVLEEVERLHRERRTPLVSRDSAS